MANSEKMQRKTKRAARIAKVTNVVDKTGALTHQLLVTVKHRTRGIDRFVVAKLDLLQATADSVRLMFFNQGLLKEPTVANIRAVAKELLDRAKGKVYVITSDGHHKFRVGKRHYECLVYAAKIYWIGASTTLRAKIVDYPSATAEPSCELDEWLNNMGRYLPGNPYLLFACCAALSGYVASFLSLPTATLSVVGQSSTGKTILLCFLQSLYKSGKFIEAATGTASGLRALLEAHPHSPLAIDELRQVASVPELLSLLFDVSNHAGRKTSNGSQQLKASAELSCTVISANERTIGELVVGKHVAVDEGFSARVFELVVEGPHGVFHSLPKGLTAPGFADRIKDRSALYFGAVAPRFIEEVAKDARAVKRRAASRIEKLIQMLSGDAELTDVTKRLMSTVAGWAYVGEIAANHGLLPVTKKQVHRAFKLVVNEYLKRQAHGLTPTSERVVAKVRELLDLNPHRFPALESRGEGSTSPAFGFTKKIKKEGPCFLIFQSVFEEKVGAEFGTRAAVAALRTAGYLVTDKQGDQYQVRMSKGDEKRKRFYAISASIQLDGD